MIVKAAAAHEVRAIRAREDDLEEIFLLGLRRRDLAGLGGEIGPILDPPECAWRAELRRKPSTSRDFLRVSDGTRTRDRLDHNQELYLLSYAHHVAAGYPSAG